MKKITWLSSLLLLLNIVIAGAVSISLNNPISKKVNNTAIKIRESLASGFTVSFTVYDDTTLLEGAWVTFNDEALQTDSTGTVVFTQVPEGTLPFLVNIIGYPDYSDEVDISGDRSIDVHMNKFHSLKFTITDGTNPLPGAVVSINGDNDTTDINGVALFGSKYPGNSSYLFTVSAPGFADSTAYANVGNSDLIVDTIALKKAYDIIFFVTDSLHNALAGALVTLDGEGITTDSAGSAIFNMKINGIYEYDVVLSGYTNKIASVSVNSANVTDTVKLSSGFDLSLTIINGPYGSPPLDGDTIIINGITKISDGNGVVIFGLHPGIYPFTVHKTGFVDTALSVQIVDKNLDLIVYLTPSYSVNFNVADALTYNPLEAASISFNGIIKHTDANGNVYFQGIRPSITDLVYIANASGGYLADTGSVSLPFSSMTVTDMNNIVQSIYLTRPGIAVSLVEDFVNYSASATIRVDGINYPYDSIVGTSFFALDTGIHQYTVIPNDITKTIVSGSFTVGLSGSDFLTIQIAEAYKVAIYAKDGSNNPIEGAAVIFNGESALTDATGEALFVRIAAGSYSYSITKKGYDTIQANAITVDTADIVEIAAMNRNLFNVTIIIHDATGYVTNAAVTLDGILINTDTTGKAIFTDKSNGDYSFKIEKQGYADSTGTVTVDNKDVILNITILLTGLKDNNIYYIQPYPNPTTNFVYINIPSEMSHTVVAVINSSGERVSQTTHESSQGTTMSIDLQEFPTGVYFIEISVKDTKKIWSVLKR